MLSSHINNCSSHCEAGTRLSPAREEDQYSGLFGDVPMALCGDDVSGISLLAGAENLGSPLPQVLSVF